MKRRRKGERERKGGEKRAKGKNYGGEKKGTSPGNTTGGELCGKGSFHIQPRMCGTLEFSDPVRVFNSTKQ